MWRVGRISAGIICMLASGAIVYDYMVGNNIFNSVIIFTGSFATWAFSEIKADRIIPLETKLHPHDVALGNELRSILDEKTKRYLKTSSFGGLIHHRNLEPISSLADWNGAQREFINTDLDNLLSEIVRLANELTDEFTENGNAVGNQYEFISIVPDQERANDWHSPETAALVATIKALAKQLAEVGDAFEKAFRKLSPESYFAMQAV